MIDLQPAGSYDEFVDLFGDVRVARGLSCERVDDICGLTRGHTNKVLGPRREKRLSPMLIDTYLPAFGIRLAVVDDPEAIARMQGRWEARDEANVRYEFGDRISRRLLDRARPHILQEIIAQLSAAAGRAA
ncbi:hypothetical protein [Bradyrhizobium sp. UFLA05-112]